MVRMGFPGLLMDAPWGYRSFVLVLLISHVASLKSEGEALLRFQGSVIDADGNLYSWGGSVRENLTDDPCPPMENVQQTSTWIGVTCGNDTDDKQTVTKLDLSYFSLRGTLSTDLADLKNLRVLNLRGNSFSGEIPSNIIKLERLSYVDLRDNLLTGTVPQFPPGTGVEKLVVHLENNLLSGNLTNLLNTTAGRLELQGNRLTGQLPDKFLETQLGRSLEHLDLSHNQFDGFLPSDLAEMPLGFCDLSENKFEGTIPDGEWSAFYWLDLSMNNLHGSIPSSMLHFGYNDTRSELSLNLSHNSLSGVIDLNLSHVPFRTLDLSFNQLENEGDVVPPSSQSPLLLVLCLENNKFSGNLHWIYEMSFRIHELRVGGNRFDGADLMLISNETSFFLPRLQVMDLHESALIGQISPDLFQTQQMPYLRVLDISNNHLQGTIPVSLTQMSSLRELRVQNNSLQGGINPEGNWTQLQVLDLSHNQFDLDKEGLEAILGINFSHLRELRLAGTNLKGIALPRIVGTLSSLEVLDFSSCNLVGPIPEEYCNKDSLPSLRFLNLSGNSLSGSLPEGCGQMPELIGIDVSSNELSGKLPLFEFRLFNSSSFAGNSKSLCGPPLDNCSHEQLAIWKVVVIVLAAVLASGGSCLFLGWRWRRKVDDKRQQQDAELIATLLDKDSTSLMSLTELRKATDDFSDEKVIGEGGFGTVYKGVLQDGTTVAIKKSKRDGSTFGHEDKRQFLNEVKILSQIRHRNLVRLLGCCLTNKHALLVFEFIPNGTLQDYLHRKEGLSPLTWTQRLNIASQMAGALDYLHSTANPPIYHLDVKSANVLLDDYLRAKVADFGVSKLAATGDATHITTLHGFKGTFGYMDPELVLKSVLTGKSDVYAFGVVLLELISAKAAVDRSRKGDDVSLVKWAGRLMRIGDLEEMIDQDLIDTYHTSDGKDSINAVAGLAQRCLRFRSEDRPTMKDACIELLSIQQKGGVFTPKSPSKATTDEILIEMSSLKPL